MQNDIIQLISFIQSAEKLKTELRDSWLSKTERQESVAEHSWMLLLIAMATFDATGLQVDQLKVLKMLVIHDLAEVIVGDISAFAHDKRINKYQNEQAAMRRLVSNLPGKTATEFLDLWEEMEAKQSNEAKLAQSIDKLEVLIQHTIADISTWGDGDYSLGPYNKDDYFDFNPYLRALKDHVNEMFWTKMDAENKLDRLQPEHLARRAKELEK